jgi:hypothetical protein
MLVRKPMLHHCLRDCGFLSRFPQQGCARPCIELVPPMALHRLDR